MKFTPILLFVVALLGCNSGSPPANGDNSQTSQTGVVDANKNQNKNKNKKSARIVAIKKSDTPPESQKDAIAAIQNLGGSVKLDKSGNLIFVDLSGHNITDARLVHLKG